MVFGGHLGRTGINTSSAVQLPVTAEGDSVGSVWLDAPPMSVNSSNMAPATLGTRIFSLNPSTQAGTQVYVSEEQRWTTVPQLNIEGFYAAAAVWLDRLYVSGGFTPPSNTADVKWIATPSATRWNTAPKLLQPRAAHAMVAFHNTLFVIAEPL